MQNQQNETNFPVKNNFPVNATKGAQVLALVFVMARQFSQTATKRQLPLATQRRFDFYRAPPPPPQRII